MSQQQQQEIDDLVTNLKILSKLEQNKKIMAKDNIINIEQDYLIPESIRRAYRGDSRDITIKKIDNIMMKSIQVTNDNIFDLKEYIISTKAGINNLRETYSECQKTQARLSTILDKIDRFISNEEQHES
jgi:hypothetical protein